MTELSQNIKNGQQFNTAAGAAAIAAGDLLEIGGPGGEAWSCATSDYAAVAAAGPLLGQTAVVSAALPGSSRQPVARDKLGNIYVAGTNGGGNLVAYKYGPLGVLIASAALDAAATVVSSAHLFQLQNGSYACVYARAAGALYFVVFDAALNLVAGPVSVATEFHSTNVAYHSACALSGGGFAVAFQTNAGTAINLATYSNLGAVVQAATSVQALAGGAAQEFVRLAQLASGNLACAFRGTMTAGGVAGTSFVVVTVSGGAVAGPVSLDSTSTAGLLELSVLPTTFGIAAANGSNLLAGVFNNAGAQQGTSYSVGDTLNSLAYPQVKLANDGTQYWLAWFSSAANGLYVAGISTGGAVTATASALGGATLSASTFALDAEVVNGLLVALAASSATAGQFWMSVGLPDASLGVVNPYARTAPSAFGSAAATAGSSWPRVMGGGGGLYRGASPPPGQPATPATCGDFTVILAYDQQNVAKTFIGIQKVESTAVLGAALRSLAAGSQGSLVSVNPGPGDYPTNNIAGSSGTPFNHIGLTPSGTAGALYTSGAGLTGMLNGPFGADASSRVGIVEDFAGPEANIPAGSLLCKGTAGSPTLYNIADYSLLFAKIGTTWGGDGVTTFAVPPANGRLRAGAENMGGISTTVLGSNPSTGGIAGTASLGTVGGQKAHTPTIPETASHHHEVTGYSATLQAGGLGSSPTLSNTTDTTDTGGGANFNVTPPLLVMNTIIWYR